MTHNQTQAQISNLDSTGNPRTLSVKHPIWRCIARLSSYLHMLNPASEPGTHNEKSFNGTHHVDRYTFYIACYGHGI
jgi:hypothetical protein